MSAGLMGVARVRRRMLPEGRDGEMECVCNLYISSVFVSPEGICMAYDRTSLGSPYFEYTRAFAWV